MMRRLSLLLPALMLPLLWSSCTTAKYEANRLDGEAWLAQYKSPAKTQVGGKWYSDDWGGGTFSQSGRNIRGDLGHYLVEGVVSGNTVYLTFSQRGWIYYTAKLTASGGVLSGFYSSSLPFTINDQRPMRLRRL